MTANEKQMAFAKEYVNNGGHGTHAAEVAGYRSARVAASKLLKRPNITLLIDEYRKELLSRFRAPTAEKIIEQITAIANDSSAINRDKLRALELLGKWKCLFSERTILEAPEPIILMSQNNTHLMTLGTNGDSTTSISGASSNQL
jgi:phage terminase small subunit